MKPLWMVVAAGVSGVCLVPACAQSSGAVVPDAPAAPMAAGSAPAAVSKPIFALPPVTYDRPTGKAPVQTMTPEEFCSSDLLKPRQQQVIPKEIKGEVSSYNRMVFTEIFRYWINHKHAMWSRERTLAVYFMIKPDGSYTMPVITTSSGKSEYDRFALNAIRGRDTYPPLPKEMTEPLKQCYVFGYNQRAGDGFVWNYDNWQKPDPAKP